MSKPASMAHELGRAIGYNVDVQLLLKKLVQTPIDRWNELDRAFLQKVERAAGISESRAPSDKPTRLWVVVKIERGVPVLLDAYRNKNSAKRREKFLRLHLRPEFEDVTLFHISL